MNGLTTFCHSRVSHPPHELRASLPHCLSLQTSSTDSTTHTSQHAPSHTQSTPHTRTSRQVWSTGNKVVSPPLEDGVQIIIDVLVAEQVHEAGHWSRLRTNCTHTPHPHRHSQPHAHTQALITTHPHTSTLTQAHSQPYTAQIHPTSDVCIRSSNHHSSSSQLWKVPLPNSLCSAAHWVDTCGGLPLLVLCGEGVVVALEAAQLPCGHRLCVCQLCTPHNKERGVD